MLYRKRWAYVRFSDHRTDAIAIHALEPANSTPSSSNKPPSRACESTTHSDPSFFDSRKDCDLHSPPRCSRSSIPCERGSTSIRLYHQHNMALIRRSRTGCFTCRSRKKKCNEARPICSGCRRNDLECRWPAPQSSAKRPKEGQIKPTAAALQPRPSNTLTASASGAVILRPRPASFSHSVPSPKENGRAAVATGEAAPATPSIQRGHSFSARRPADLVFDITDPAPILDTIIIEANGIESYSRFSTAMDPQEVAPSSPAPSKYYLELSPSSTSQVSSYSSSSSSSSSSPPPTVVIPPNGVVGSGVSAITNLDDIPFDPSPDQTHSLQDLQLCLTKPLSLFPHHDKYSPDLLGFYLDRTANCMGNGSTDSNPFITKLIPLAFSHPLLLQLIMAQSAVHRQMSKDRHPSDEVARRSYSDSLRYFRTVVDGYVSGREEDTLVLTVGSLILSLTEVRCLNSSTCPNSRL